MCVFGSKLNWCKLSIMNTNLQVPGVARAAFNFHLKNPYWQWMPCKTLICENILLLVKIWEQFKVYSESRKKHMYVDHKSQQYSQTFLYSNLGKFGEYECLSICTFWFNFDMNENIIILDFTKIEYSKTFKSLGPSDLQHMFYSLQQGCRTYLSSKKNCKDTLSMS
jgi:hypothetical protein